MPARRLMSPINVIAFADRRSAATSSPMSLARRYAMHGAHVASFVAGLDHRDCSLFARGQHVGDYAMPRLALLARAASRWSQSIRQQVGQAFMI